jgi:hypothetical protein
MDLYFVAEVVHFYFLHQKISWTGQHHFVFEHARSFEFEQLTWLPCRDSWMMFLIHIMVDGFLFYLYYI